MKLKELREKSKISQRELAEQIDIPVQTLFGYEKGTREPNIATLIKLADYYHITIDELVGRPTNLLNKMLLTDRERNIIEKILAMNEKQQELTEFYIDTMMKSI